MNIVRFDLAREFLDLIEGPAVVVEVSSRKIVAANRAAGEIDIDSGITCYSYLSRSDKPCGGKGCLLDALKASGDRSVRQRAIDSFCGRDESVLIDGVPLTDEKGLFRYALLRLVRPPEADGVEQRLESKYKVADPGLAPDNSFVSSIVYTKNLIDSSLDMIISVDTDRKIVEFNKAAERVFGYKKGEVFGRPIGILYADARDAAAVSNVLAGEGRFSGRVANITKSGKRFVSYLSSSAVRSEKGKLLGYMGVSRDISDQLKAERELKRSKESLVQAQEIAKLGNWDWDFVGDRLYWSDEVYRIFGLEPQKFASTFDEYLSYAHPDDREFFKESVFMAVKEKKQLDILNRIVLPGGGVRTVREKAEVFYGENGQPIRMVGTVQDITEQVERETMLKSAKEKAENATKLKDKFVTLVSHDLKGPIGTMIGFINLVLDNSSHKLGSEESMILQRAVDSGIRMTELIDELLTLTRMKTGVIQPKNTFVNVRILISSALKDVQQAADRKGVEIVAEVPVSATIFADKTLVQVVIQNIVANAVKFCRKGDAITIRMQSGEPTTIMISDTGIGIDESIKPDLFLFDKKTSTIGTGGEVGTGIGLPICKDIMEAHGGGISIESKSGEGSCFKLSFPYARPIVLIVDDNELQRNLFKERLKGIDLDFIEAENGMSAIEMLEHSDTMKPHLIVLNLNMPVMDGFSFLNAIKGMEKYKQIPVIMATADTDIETRRKALDLGADDFICKLSETDELIYRIKRFVY